MPDSMEDLKGQLDVLQDDVDLIKNQIKQSLVDLREFVMASKTVFPVQNSNNLLGSSLPRPEDLTKSRKTGLHNGNVSSPSLLHEENVGRNFINEEDVSMGSKSLDSAMVSNIAWWLGTIKRRGLSLRQLGHFLEAYETSGLLDHSTGKLVRVMIRSMEDVNEARSVPSREDQVSTEEYADCLLQFSEIFCAPAPLNRVVVSSSSQYSESDNVFDNLGSISTNGSSAHI